MGDLIGGIILAVILTVFSSVVEANYRSTMKLFAEGDEGEFVVKLPNSVNWIYRACYALGIVMMVTFGVSAAMGNPTVTLGHFVVSGIVIAMGVLFHVLCRKSCVIVKKSELMIIYRLFRKPYEIDISRIKYRISKKGQIFLYCDGKRLKSVSLLSDNYKKLLKVLGCEVTKIYRYEPEE